MTHRDITIAKPFKLETADRSRGSKSSLCSAEEEAAFETPEKTCSTRSNSPEQDDCVCSPCNFSLIEEALKGVENSHATSHEQAKLID